MGGKDRGVERAYVVAGGRPTAAQVAKGSELWLLNAVPARERERRLDEEGTRRELRPSNLVLRRALWLYGGCQLWLRGCGPAYRFLSVGMCWWNRSGRRGRGSDLSAEMWLCDCATAQGCRAGCGGVAATLAADMAVASPVTAPASHHRTPGAVIGFPRGLL